MRYSQYFIKTLRDAPSEAVSDSHKLLLRGGFIRQIASGRYALLPIGFKVNQKIIEIIDEEMKAIGAQRVELPIMQPIEVWQVTNRDDAFGSLMMLSDDHFGHKYVLNATGEALMTELIGRSNPSYKELPINVYQFLTKFRDEIRPRGGLMRAREFLMKDGYNFEKDEESFMKTYQAYWKAYEKIFSRVGLNIVIVEADSGALGGDYSHEFMVEAPEQVEPLDIYNEDNVEALELEEVNASTDESLFKEILKIYNQEPEKTLKNLIFRADGDDFVCVTIRGDYKIDFVKLRRLLKYKQIRPATSDELLTLNTFMGYVSAKDLDEKVKIVIDDSVKFNKNYWDGAHKEKAFNKNVNFPRDFKVKETVDVHEDKIFTLGGDRIVSCDRCDYKANVEKAEFVREPVNIDEEMKPMEVVEQPEWVCSMEDNVQHYKKSKAHFLKNVVYKDSDGKIIIAALRGDLEANPTKISNLLRCGELELADDDDLAKIGTQRGWVHSWGHDEGRDDVIYVCDEALTVSRNLIGGQKQKDSDTINVNFPRDFNCDYVGDISSATEGSRCTHCDEGYLKETKTIEVGHIFKYDHFYSIPHKANYVDQDGKLKPLWMGAYGIGVGRCMATVAELFHDDRGLMWPDSIAPFKVHLVSLGDDESVLKKSEDLYNDLVNAGIEVLWDDREDVSAGVKFADADLLGNPIRLVVSNRNLKQNVVEFKKRDSEENEMIDFDKIVDFVKKL